MTIDVNPLGPLGWGSDASPHEQFDPPTGPAPLFEGRPGGPVFHAPDDVTAGHLDLLGRGRATTVVTGQQPGRLVGPLYTLFKIATAVDLAAHRTAAGLPTVPVFWSGDADDDLDEAMAPACWDPSAGGFLDLPAGPGRKRPGRVDPMVGRLNAADTVTAESAWLDKMASLTGHPLGRDLASIWAEAIDGKLTWTELQHRALARIFSGSGLVIVSGNDSALHKAAEPLYREIRERMDDLVKVGDEGSGPISDHSWRRPLFRVEGDARLPLEPDGKPAAGDLIRPGVVFRSPVQDWLLRPAAVVAGPGELAYLKQLEPVYERLGIPRSPLVPRLSGWLLPAGGVPGDLLEPETGHAPGDQAARVVAAGRRELESVLTGELGLNMERARELSGGRTRRWIKGLETMLRDETRRAREARTGRFPGWVFPHGDRQERTLAAGCALALWGDDLTAAIIGAAALHRQAGADGAWRTFGLTVPDPALPKGNP